MDEDQAAKLLAECCGSSRWVAMMTSRRPFGTRDVVFAIAEDVYDLLEPNDWLEAFAHHPRIGERTGAVAQGERGSTWSIREQSGVDHTARDVRDQLALTNNEYEQRFGYIYIVCAAGKGADEMLSLARERLRNDPADEMRIAAEEQRRIMRLRLAKLLDNTESQ